MELSNQLATFIFEMNNCQYITKGEEVYFSDGTEFYQGGISTLVSHNRLRSDKLVKVIKQAISAEKLTGKGKESINVSEANKQLNNAIKVLREKQELLVHKSTSIDEHNLETSLNLSLFGRNVNYLLDIIDLLQENQTVKEITTPLTYNLLANIDNILSWYKAFGEEATGDEYPLWLSRFYNESEKLPSIKFEDRFKTKIHAMLRLVQIFPKIGSCDQDLSRIKAPRRNFNFDKFVELRWGIKSYKQFIADNDVSIKTTMDKLIEEVESKR